MATASGDTSLAAHEVVGPVGAAAIELATPLNPKAEHSHEAMMRLRLLRSAPRAVSDGGDRCDKCLRRKLSVKAVFVLSVFCLIYCVCKTFGPPLLGKANNALGVKCDENMPFCYCPYETLCVRARRDIILLSFSRTTAYFGYPLYMVLFLSKAHNLRRCLMATPLSEYIKFDDVHELHELAGIWSGLLVTIHTIAHLTRWSMAGNISLLWTHVTGITGFVCISLTPLVVLPMAVPALKKCITFEWRKALHYLSFVWGLVICFHAPTSHIFFVIGIPLLVYVLDWAYVFCFRTHFLHTVRLTRLAHAVEVVWENPPGFHVAGGGYVYINLPFVSKTQWHALSVMPHPSLPNHSSVCMAVVGDWTRRTHRLLQRPSVRPGWVCGPFPSPFSTAVNFDSIITVASGIGITTGLAIVTGMRATRKVNVVWICREADLLEYHMQRVTFDDDGWTFVFYTGTRDLVLHRKVIEDNPMVKIFLGRPDLEAVMNAIIGNLHDGIPMPAEVLERAEASHRRIFERAPEQQFRCLLARLLETYNPDELFEMAAYFSDKTLEEEAAWDFGPKRASKRVSMRATKRISMAAMLIDDVTGDVTKAGFERLLETHCSEGLEAPWPWEDKLEKSFRAVRSRGGHLQRHGFLEVLKELQSLGAEAGKGKGKGRQEGRSAPWKPKDISEYGADEVPTMVASAHGDRAAREQLGTWEMLYCGGAAPIVQQLRAIQEKYHVALKVETFNW